MLYSVAPLYARYGKSNLRNLHRSLNIEDTIAASNQILQERA